MAVTLDTLKLTQVQGVVAVREDGSTPAAGTIALSTTLKKGTESESSAIVDISALYWALGDGVTATVSRGSDMLYHLSLSGKMEFYGFSDNTNNTDDNCCIDGRRRHSRCSVPKDWRLRSSTASRRRWRLRIMKLIKEVTEEIQYISEINEETGKKSHFIEGVFLQADLTNRIWSSLSYGDDA